MTERIIAPLVVFLCFSVSVSSGATPSPSVSASAADRLLIVHCLLPGQVRQLGSRTTYVSPRRGAKITAAECEVRGGEYVREDRADLTSALAVWLPAAREGDVEAQINVGTLFERGLGQAPDFREAAIWYRKAAEGGSIRAQLKLSELYESGRGVPLDLEEALRWYQLAMGGTDTSTVVVNALATRNAELSVEMNSIIGQLEILRADNARLQEALANGLQQSEHLVGENSAIGEEIAQLKTELDARQREIDRLTEKLGATGLALQDAEQTAAEAARTNEKGSSALEGAQAEISEQQAALDGQQLAIGELDSSLAEIRDQLAAERTSVVELNARVANLQTNTRGAQSLEFQAGVQAVFAPPSLILIDPKLAVTRGLVKVSAPSPGTVIRIVGRVSAPAGLLSLSVGGTPVEPNEAGVFLTDLNDVAGRSVSILAVDQAGQTTEVSFDYQAEPPARTARTSTVAGLEGLPFGRYKALVIGNNRYGSLPVLQSAEADAVAVAQLLGARYGFEVKLLRNATRFQILSALNELREALTSEDNLVIYYAGHGELDRVNMRGYWLPVDADRTNTANWISNVAITDILNAMSAKHVLLLADSCYSGALTRSALTSLAAGRTAEEELNWVRTMLGKRSRQALTSGGLQPVLDAGGGTHSIFARALIKVLESNESLLEGHDLFEAVAARVAYQSSNLQFEQVPEFAPIRHAGHEAGAFFLLPTD